jgi:hypothetical protein
VTVEANPLDLVVEGRAAKVARRAGGSASSNIRDNRAGSACDAQKTKERFVMARQLTFNRIQDTTADDWAIIATRPNTKLFEDLPDRLLGALRFLENGDFFTVNGLGALAAGRHAGATPRTPCRVRRGRVAP